MGLDMYIDKVKRVGNLKLKKILATEDYVDYLNRPKEYADRSFKDWCGYNENMVVKSAIGQVKANMEYDTSPAWAEGWDDYKPSRKRLAKNIAYWRKANAIHKWFVENIQDGNDDCGMYELDRDDLETLLDTVNTVLESRDPLEAARLLPTRSGFFFGDTEYNEWYFEYLEYTKERIEKILRETDFDNWIVYYVSSW